MKYRLEAHEYKICLVRNVLCMHDLIKTQLRSPRLSIKAKSSGTNCDNEFILAGMVLETCHIRLGRSRMVLSTCFALRRCLNEITIIILSTPTAILTTPRGMGRASREVIWPQLRRHGESEPRSTLAPRKLHCHNQHA